MSTTPRKWSAIVSVAGQDVTAMMRPTDDTLGSVTAAAKDLVDHLIRHEEMGSDASIVLFKQLKGDREPVRDRSYYCYGDWNSKGFVIRSQFQGA